MRIARRLLLAALASSLASNAAAAVTEFTSKAAFDAATAALAPLATVGFEDLAAGTILPNGSSVGVPAFAHSVSKM